MKDILSSISKLFKVKSLITLIMTGMFAFALGHGIVNGEQFIAIYTVVIGFYFGIQTMKDSKKEIKQKTDYTDYEEE